MNKSHQSISKKITHVYFLGAVILLAFYSIAFKTVILQTENYNSKQRLNMVASFYFGMFERGQTGAIKIDPLVTIFDDFSLLPNAVRQSVSDDWQGNINLHFDDDSEYNLVATKIDTPQGHKIVYALEDIDAIEWDDGSFAMFEVAFLIAGMMLFLIAAGFVVKMAQRIGAPFEKLARQLSKDNTKNFTPITIDGELSKELLKTLASINSYRLKIGDAIEREQAFTRYISHELRTPMTVIRGSLSILRRQPDDKIIKQVNRIDAAISEMEQLTRIFLLIARDTSDVAAPLDIDQRYIDQCIDPISKKMTLNNVEFNRQFQQQFSLQVEPLLLQAVIQNLCLNAINCSVDGRVSLFVSPQGIDVIDNGVGLDAKPRGYEGFGIGLNLVRDICAKYHWEFQLVNNEQAGCTASITFDLKS